MKDLSIIIVSYNTVNYLKSCLISIFETAPRSLDFEVIVVDNNSKDGTVKEVQSSKFKVQNESSKFKIIANKDNLGFSKANNIGVKESTGEFILFLNPDTVVQPKTLETMGEFMKKNKEVGAATCKVQLSNGMLDDASHRGFPTPWNSLSHFSGLSKLFSKSKLFGGYNQGWKDLNSTHEIDACAGAFMIVQRKAGEQIGWWDEDFFFYGEDLDFCFRLKEKNWKIYYVPTCSILHYKGISGGIKKHSEHLSSADVQTKKIATRERFNAMKIFYEKHYKNKYPKFIQFLVIQGINLKQKLSS